MNDIKLSICMMVKNEEENLARCLTSIQNTCAREDVELIILDTGSSDSTVEIAKRYTDNVYFHEWNCDFSAMRNKSISFAKGEWILILDADEEFENEKSIEELLNYHKLETYNTIQITLRNFTSSVTNIFSQLPSLRFFKNNGFKYTGAVHNQPVYQMPIYYDTNIILNHYGYNNDDQALMERKYQRTKNLLLKELEKDPNNIYYLYQLTQSYYMNGKDLLAYETIKKTIGKLKSKAEKVNYINLYERYATICVKLEKFAEAEQLSQQGIDINPEYIDLYFLNVLSKIKNGKKEEAIPYIKKYLLLSKDLLNLNISKNPSIELYRVSQKDQDMMLTEMVNYYIDKKEFEKSFDYLAEINDPILKDKLIIIYSFAKNDFNFLYNHYISLEQNKENFEMLIESQLPFHEEEHKNAFYKAFSKGESIYAQFNQIRATEDDINAGLLKSIEYKIDFNELPSFYLQVLLETFKDDPNRFFHSLKKVKTSYVRQIISNYFIRDKSLKTRLVDYLNSKKVRNTDTQGNRVFYVIAFIIILDAIENNENEKVYDIYHKYIHAGSNFTTSLYNFNTLKLMYKTIDDIEIRFFVLQLIIEEFMKRKDFRQVLKLYHEALSAMPMLSGFIKTEIVNLKSQLNYQET